MGWAPLSLRSMIASRRGPRPTPGAVQTPLPSGPRCASASAIAVTRAGSTGLGTSGWKMPAMPHMGLGEPRATVGEPVDRAERAEEIVDRRARADPGGAVLGRNQDRDRA